MSDGGAVQFHVIPVREWYEKHEMLEDVRTYGFPVTEGLFDDWVEKGLLGRAHRVGLGRGRGSTARWPSGQFTLLLELLRGRQLGKFRIGQLCALPVWRWIYWGELGGVSLPQVRRAMDTWVASVKNTTTDTERKEVRRAVEKVQGISFSGKRALLDELMRVGTFEKDADADVLRYRLESVITSSPWNVVFQDGKTSPVDVEMLSIMIPIRQKAFRNYEQIVQLPDTMWEWARTFLLFAQRRGQSERPFLARNRRLADRYRRLTIYDVLWGSCSDLLSPLAIAAQKLFPEEESDPIPFLNPRVWQEERATSMIETTLMHSSVLLPDGSNVAYLRNEVHMAYREKAYQFTLDLPFL